MPDTTFLEPFESVVSLEEGLGLVRQSTQELTDAIADALLARATDLRAAGDPDGADEFAAWAGEARSLVTHNRILATPISGQQDGMAVLTAQRERFDDAFIQLCSNIPGELMGRLSQAVDSGNLQDAQACASDLKEKVEFHLGFLKVVASVSGKPAHQAQADFEEGCWLLILSRLEKMGGDTAPVSTTVDRAKAAFAQCAATLEAPPVLRSKAENNLATLGFPDMEEVNLHQEAALRLAEEAADWELARESRRNRAYWARQRADWQTVHALEKKNVDAAEAAILKEYSPQLTPGLVKAAKQDVLALVEACLHLGASDPTYYERALEAAEWGKSRAFLRSATTIASAYKPIPERLRRREDRLLQMSAEWSRNLGIWPAEVAERRRPEAEYVQTLIGRTQAQIEKFAIRRAFDLRCFPCRFADMVEIVPVGGAILSYFVFSERIVVFALGEKGLLGPPVDIELGRKDLANILVNIQVTSAMRAHFKDWDQIQRNIDMRIDAIWPTDKLAFLYQKLLAPVADYIRGRSVIYISPDDLLFELPLHALLKPDGSALIDDTPVAYAPGLTVLRRALGQEKSGSGESIFSAGVSAANHGPDSAQEEARTVARFFAAEAAPATHDAVLSRGMPAHLLHLSCHSNLENALTSFQGLQLEDGLLTPPEIIAAGCKASLAFLSACETSRGDLHGGEELAGFVGAFLRAGCPSVIACMWRLPEGVCLDLVNVFYEYLVQKKSSKAEALQAAVLALKKQERFNHPYFWAPICLYGAA